MYIYIYSLLSMFCTLSIFLNRYIVNHYQRDIIQLSARQHAPILYYIPLF